MLRICVFRAADSNLPDRVIPCESKGLSNGKVKTIKFIFGIMDNFRGIVQNALQTDSVFWKSHMLNRMRERSITADEILYCLKNGDIVEQYESDKPFPSALVIGFTEKGRPIHVVVGMNVDENELHIVTTYEPELDKWEDGFRKRR